MYNLITFSLKFALILTLTGFAAPINISSIRLFSVRYIPPPDRGTPTSERGTGSRGECLYQADLPPMAALVGESHLSLTVSDHPMLWAYLPYTAADASHTEVVIQSDTRDEELYRGTFPLSNTPGIMGIRFPASAPTLEVDETYRWYIDVACSSASSGPRTEILPATLTGVVKRAAASPELTQALQASSTPIETLEAYGKYHIWYDLLSQLAEYRLRAAAELRSEETTFEQLWIDLLSDEAGANLGEYAEAPLVGIVTVEAIASNSP